MDGPYELEPLERGPDTPPGVLVRPAVEDVIEAIASDLFLHAMNCVRAFGDFNLALSGGRTHVRLYQTLMLDPQFRAFPWKRTHLWAVSEDVSVPEHESTGALLRDLIASHSDIPREQFHPIDRIGGAAAYASVLRETLGWREPGHDRLDYVLLGLGADGSTAGHAAADPVDPSALVRESAEPGTGHISLGMHAINGARFVAIVAFGADKQDEARRAIGANGHALQPRRPIDHVRPVGGELRWYLDAAAFGEGVA